MSGPTKSERDIWEVSNQLAGFVGPNTPDDLAEFLIRESKAAADLAAEITRLRAEVERLPRIERNRDMWRGQCNGQAEQLRIMRALGERKDADIARKDEALANAAGFLDTPISRRRNVGDSFYDETVRSIRAARMPTEGRAALEQEGG